MLRDLLGAFTGLFTERRNRLEVAGLLLVMAMLPVSELLVTRLFSHLVIDGAERLEAERGAVVLAAAGFFAAFAASRAIHHVVRLNRVRVFRRGFESSQQHRPRQQEAWSWAAAFELSTASVALIQVLAFCALFVWLDPVFGVLNVAIGAGVLALVALIYRRQLAHQLSYLVEQRGATTEVGERVGRRLRDAELGAVLASLAMALALALVLLRAVTGAMAAADAIVLFIGLRMMYSQLGHLSASAMRFARVEARLRGGRATGDADPDDEADVDAGADDEDPRSVLDQPPDSSPHRATLVRQMVAAGQAGDLPTLQSYAARLRAAGGATPQEADARQVAEAFAALRAPLGAAAPLPLTWWPRPFPGTLGNWVLPLLVRRLSGRPVAYVKPGSAGAQPHLLVGTSLLATAGPATVVLGAGVLDGDVRPDPRATVLSVRGPLSAAALRRAGGPAVEAWGDPVVLAARAVPLPGPGLGSTGRLAVLRHASQAHLPLLLPEGADELSTAVSRPDDLVALLTTLASYDGVVTSDPGVAALCHGYGLPCASVALEPRDDLDHVLRDHALGLGLDDVVSVPTGTDLRRTDLEGLLATHVVAPRVLDELQQRLDEAVARCVGQAAAV